MRDELALRIDGVRVTSGTDPRAVDRFHDGSEVDVGDDYAKPG